MKRIYVIIASLALLAGLHLMVTCSNPLDRDDGPDPNPPVIDTVTEFDTIFLVDTVSTTDTLVVHDTTTATDTLIVFDTIQQSDTIIVVDTLIEGDTIVVVDTVISSDTVTVVDTVTTTDTVIVIDSTTVLDTIIIVDTTVQIDTVIAVDTISMTDTLNVVDTIMFFDTVLVMDTLYATDTLMVYDTVMIADTVTIVVPDSNCIHTVCAKLSPDLHEIVWKLQNTAGTFQLVFEATVQGAKPPRTLTVAIDGVEYEWDITESLVLTLVTPLAENATVVVTPNQPVALGHRIDVCVTLESP